MDVAVLKKMGKVKRFQMDEYICVEGEEGHNAFLLLSGSAEVTIKAFRDRYEANGRSAESQRFFRPKAFRNKKNAIATIPVGAVIGEMSLLSDLPRSASVVVTSDEALCLVLDKDNFNKVIDIEPEIGFNLIKILCGRLDKSMSALSSGNPTVARINKEFEFESYKALDKNALGSVLEKNPDYMRQALEKLSNWLSSVNVELSRQV